MANAKKPRPIRLSNRTAIGLRKTAQRVRSAWLIVMCVVTMLSTVLAVYLGFSWLPAVPLTLMAGGCVIALMLLASRSQYLLLISQAICTEAASRQMDERRTELQRRKKAIEQLAAIRADVREAEKNGLPREEMRSEESLLFDLLTGREPSEEELEQKRRSEEDEEMYAASYQGEQDADEEDDLYPPKKSKKPAAEGAKTAPDQTTGTKPVKKAVIAETPAQQAQEGGQTRRRRRRSADSGTAPLTLIRNDQAQ